MGWKENAIMEWNGTKVTDHGRGPLSENKERIGTDKRMHDGTLRRQHINVKRSWTTTWENLPNTNASLKGMKTADGNMAGEDIEHFYYNNPGKFRMVLRRGSALDITSPAPADSALPYEDSNFYVVNVMITEFSKETHKRGAVDLLSMSITLEEV